MCLPEFAVVKCIYVTGPQQYKKDSETMMIGTKKEEIHFTVRGSQ